MIEVITVLVGAMIEAIGIIVFDTDLELSPLFTSMYI